jgi:hypothetical protein
MGGAIDGRGTGDGDGGLGGASRGMGHGTVVAITHKTQLPGNVMPAFVVARLRGWMVGGTGQGGNNTKRR